MDFIQANILNITIFFPLLAALIILMMPEDEKNLIRRLTFAFSLVPLVLVLVMWFTYDRAAADLQFMYFAEWFPSIGANYHVGIDGISLPMFLLSALLTPWRFWPPLI
jgi:NADH:ubiquinone oxidoreductase subunit 4 (subunit M)